MELSENQIMAKNVISTIGAGIVGGSAAKIIHYSLLSPEAKFAFNNSRKSLDTFVSEAAKCAEEAMKNPKLKIDAAKVKENAAKMYEMIAQKAPQTAKALKRTELIAAIGVMSAAALISHIIIPKIKANKANQKG